MEEVVDEDGVGDVGVQKRKVGTYPVQRQELVLRCNCDAILLN